MAEQYENEKELHRTDITMWKGRNTKNMSEITNKTKKINI